MRTAPHRILKKYYEGDAARRSFVSALFDGAAQHYDWVCRVMSLGAGQLYRRQALARTGLAAGMRLLDVATGTGLVARSAIDILGEANAVVGLDPSRGMLEQAGRALTSPLVQARAEALPFRSDRFDRVSMGYALRHVAELEVTFREFSRVLKPGGRLLILEISRPRLAMTRWVLQLYLQGVLPLIARLGTGNRRAELLVRYYWETIAECVPAETIMGVLQASGFVEVEHRVLGGFLAEYVATKPG
jgi:demethylmenaquinone methyltransferase / 2-methoxy-6-polyprenyl-1,4-benzoquinol methylase